jgi:hypothetical protein
MEIFLKNRRLTIKGFVKDDKLNVHNIGESPIRELLKKSGLNARIAKKTFALSPL